MQETTAAKKTRTQGLDQILARHWNDEPLITASAPPVDPATLSASARFADAVLEAAPNWVLLPIPPQNRDAAKRHVNALRRRGMDAVMRPAHDHTRAWAIWACAKTSDKKLAS